METALSSRHLITDIYTLTGTLMADKTKTNRLNIHLAVPIVPDQEIAANRN